MDKFSKFVKEDETIFEKVLGRDHLWYFNPEITQGADTILVKVNMKKGGFHHFHRHPEMNEILYILKGSCEQWVEDKRQILNAGDAVYISPNQVHASFNAGDEDLEFLAILAPAEGWQAGTIDEFQNEPYASLRK